MRTVHSIVLFLTLLLLASCSLQKRSYQRGYYLSWNKHSAGTVAKVQTASRTDAKPGSITPIETQLSTDVTSPRAKMSLAEVRQQTRKDPDPCDTLVLQNGTEVKAKVIEINTNEVKYKYCNNLNGPTIVVYKSDVKMIRYANGEKEEFAGTKPVPLNTKQSATEKYVSKQAQGALIFGAISFILGYFGIITAGIAIAKARKALRLIGKDGMNTSNYRMARAGLMLGIIFYCLVAFFLLILLLVLMANGVI